MKNDKKRYEQNPRGRECSRSAKTRSGSREEAAYGSLQSLKTRFEGFVSVIVLTLLSTLVGSIKQAVIEEYGNLDYEDAKEAAQGEPQGEEAARKQQVSRMLIAAFERYQAKYVESTVELFVDSAGVPVEAGSPQEVGKAEFEVAGISCESFPNPNKFVLDGTSCVHGEGKGEFMLLLFPAGRMPGGIWLNVRPPFSCTEGEITIGEVGSWEGEPELVHNSVSPETRRHSQGNPGSNPKRVSPQFYGKHEAPRCGKRFPMPGRGVRPEVPKHTHRKHTLPKIRGAC